MYKTNSALIQIVSVSALKMTSLESSIKIKFFTSFRYNLICKYFFFLTPLL